MRVYLAWSGVVLNHTQVSYLVSSLTGEIYLVRSFLQLAAQVVSRFIVSVSEIR